MTCQPNGRDSDCRQFRDMPRPCSAAMLRWILFAAPAIVPESPLRESNIGRAGVFQCPGSANQPIELRAHFRLIDGRSAVASHHPQRVLLVPTHALVVAPPNVVTPPAVVVDEIGNDSRREHVVPKGGVVGRRCLFLGALAAALF